MEITLQDQIKEVGREIGLRKNVYPKFVASKRMTQDEADMHIARLEAAYRTLKGAAELIAETARKTTERNSP